MVGIVGVMTEQMTAAVPQTQFYQGITSPNMITNNPPPTRSRMDEQLDDLDRATTRLAVMVEKARTQLAPVSRSEPVNPNDALMRPDAGPHTMRIFENAAKVNALADDLMQLLACLDV